jgi:Protein of unknown function (DUF1203)
MTTMIPATTVPATFTIEALPTDILERVRATGVDASGNPVERLTADSGEPLRCCLRNASAGEALLLFGYQPPLPSGPYREVGPVYAHAERCPGYGEPHAYPAVWCGRPQVLRAYDARGWIHEATRVHDGQAPESVIAQMLAVPEVVEIHSRNVAYGCYMFRIARA